MTARCVAGRRLFFPSLVLAVGSAFFGALTAGCYTGGSGTDPPTDTLYFPVGLTVSKGGNVLYAVNSDFDLQWNGGTLQSYDLFLLRRDIDALIRENLGLSLPGDPVAPCPPGSGPPACIPVLTPGWSTADCLAASTTNTAAIQSSTGTRDRIGETCAPPVDSTQYQRYSVTIGAFATQIQLSHGGQRLFAPVRGSASVTFADVPVDTSVAVPAQDPHAPRSVDGGADWPTASPDLFQLQCGAAQEGARCSAANEVGNVVDVEDTRSVTMPGEPFGMAITSDDTAVAVTHQTSGNTSLLLTGLADDVVATSSPLAAGSPSMQFVLSGVPTGGDSLASVPHDDSPDSPATGCEFTVPPYTPPCVRPAFLETNHSAPEIDLLRYYDDPLSTLRRPFLERESATPLTAAQGTDTRGIAIDPTPRLACRFAVSPTGVDPCVSAPQGLACQQWTACGSVPSRVFIATRSPPALLVGQLGAPSISGDGTFDPDRLVISQPPVALAAGSANVVLAPIVNALGRYELRVFVVCFDSNQIFVYDPANQVVENVINVGIGPFAFAVDPFDLTQVARGDVVPPDARQTDPSLKVYRFAYVALFTDSFLQVIDLDDSLPTVSPSTFENIVFTLGVPTTPKGT